MTRYKIEYINSEDKITRRVAKKSFKVGGYNDLPPKLKPSTENHFVQMMLHNTPYEMEHRQPCHKDAPGQAASAEGKQIGSMEIFWYHDGTYLAISSWGESASYWEGKLCDHDYETTTQKMCYWEGVCKKCGHEHMIDSSD